MHMLNLMFVEEKYSCWVSIDATKMSGEMEGNLLEFFCYRLFEIQQVVLFRDDRFLRQHPGLGLPEVRIHLLLVFYDACFILAPCFPLDKGFVRPEVENGVLF